MASQMTNDARAADEAYRILRSTVKFAAGETPVRTVLIVDIDRAEPSGVADQLAAAFARAGDRCVLVETDPRGGERREAGFSDLIHGSAQVAEVTRAGDVPGLARVGAGTATAPDVLAGSGVATALGLLLAVHDHVILRSAPLPQNGDALALAPNVDATILVVTAGKSRRPRAIEARDALERVGARLLGVVMVEGKRRLFW
jgi:Mrp family chromosome partitioning ATPase